MRKEKWPDTTPEPDLANARVRVGRGCGMQGGGVPPNDLFDGLAEMIEYIRRLENRIIDLENSIADQASKA